jgi:hypothetical protein
LSIIFQIFTRIRNLLFYPAKEWEEIASENHNRQTIYRRFVAPLLFLITLATVIGTWLATSREHYSAGYVVFIIAVMWAALSAGLYVSSFVIAEIMAHQVGSRNHLRVFALMAYSLGATYLVIAFVALIPFFSELAVLAFYSCYLYWRGIPYLIGVEGQKQMIYGILSFIVVVLVYLLMFFVFGKILNEILV